MAERVTRTLKQQCVHRHRFESLRNASRVLGDWIGFCWTAPGQARTVGASQSPDSHDRYPHRPSIYLIACRIPVVSVYRFEANKEQLSKGTLGLHSRKITKDLQRAGRPAQRNDLAGFQPQTALGNSSTPGN
ncbi:hypothetical protein [Comamonas sp. BIGb0152]|uniref:hypothetical protein n=1 Tax=Comamonas sp. BIGb0152 TaxID=2940601 RepID=UPI00216A9409|nr:hypothetical protein [Comamonas sp. BIGb0152]